MDDSTIRGIVGKHDNGKPETNISLLKKKLKAWSELPSYLHRKYFFCTNAQLKVRILELDGQVNVAGKKDVLLDRVAKCERKSLCCNSMLEDNKDPFDNDEVDPVLHDILKASKLKPLGDEAKKNSWEGQLLEGPFLKKIINIV